MAARRLLILMLVLLAISTVAAALVPPQAERETERGTNGATGERDRRADRDEPRRGRLIEASIFAGARKPHTIRLERGNQLALTVRSRGPDRVEIPAFGQLEDVGRDDPARFDLLPNLTGVFEVRLLDADRVIARIAVRARER